MLAPVDLGQGWGAEAPQLQRCVHCIPAYDVAVVVIVAGKTPGLLAAISANRWSDLSSELRPHDLVPRHPASSEH